jgi:peptide/histidine transporter 3/4
MASTAVGGNGGDRDGEHKKRKKGGFKTMPFILGE